MKHHLGFGTWDLKGGNLKMLVGQGGLQKYIPLYSVLVPIGFQLESEL